MAFSERRFTAQDGLSLYFRDYGAERRDKTSVLCLAGLTRNSNDFSLLAEQLSSDRRVICPDYRGRGKSEYDSDWRNYTSFTYINDIRHLLISLNLNRVFVIGTSMGGLLTMGMGAAMPTTLAGALINDVGPVIEKRGLDKILAYMQEGASGFDDWETAAAYLRERFPNLPAETNEDWLYIARGTFQEGADGRIEHNWDYNLIRPILNETEEPELWPLFLTLTDIPLVVTRGGISDILSAATLDAMVAAAPDLTAVTVDGVGHMPNLMESECQEAMYDALDRADYAHH